MWLLVAGQVRDDIDQTRDVVVRAGTVGDVSRSSRFWPWWCCRLRTSKRLVIVECVVTVVIVIVIVFVLGELVVWTDGFLAKFWLFSLKLVEQTMDRVIQDRTSNCSPNRT
jgi:hypothetical protein